MFSKQDKNYNVRYVSVPGGGGSKAVYFPIVPTEIGNVKLSVLAQAGHAGDAVEIPLRVEPEGYRVDRNVPVVIDLTPTGNNSANGFQKTVELQFPSDYVEGSRKARIDVIGKQAFVQRSYRLRTVFRRHYGASAGERRQAGSDAVRMRRTEHDQLRA